MDIYFDVDRVFDFGGSLHLTGVVSGGVIMPGMVLVNEKDVELKVLSQVLGGHKTTMEGKVTFSAQNDGYDAKSFEGHRLRAMVVQSSRTETAGQ